MLLKKSVKWLLRGRSVIPLIVWYLRLRIYLDTPQELKVPSAKRSLLALSPERFLGDLEILAATGTFRIYRLEKSIVDVLILFCWDQSLSLKYTLEPSTCEVPDQLEFNRARLRSFYQMLLPKLYKSLGIDAVIGAAVHYRQDHDWGVVSKQIGVPYIILFKECLITNKKHHDRIVNFYSRFDRECVSSIVVHNEKSKKAIQESGIVSTNRVVALGCLRMDSYVSSLPLVSKVSKKQGKVVLLFSFPHGVGLYGLTTAFPDSKNAGFFRLFKSVHQVIGKMSLEMEDTKFIIKPKWAGQWLRYVEKELETVGVFWKESNNLSIVVDEPAHDLIMKSDVVVSFGSTTMLEAAIANKPVIVPLYHEAAEEIYKEYIQLVDTFEVLDCANSPEHLDQMIRRRLINWSIDNKIINERRELFSEYISPVTGGAIHKYVDHICDEIDRVEHAR